ncbi:MAG TPA: tetratricopeptide repeat protein, partial [Pyrinomonadaceae bacterium]|nr:tetratricopeptide repeat protein [Pyrinomonadaceae bacterium]
MRATHGKITLAAAALALASFAAGCRGGAPDNARQSNAGAQATAQSNAQAGAAAPVADVAKLNADIERLEKAAERNPGDDDTLDELARAYVRRGDSERAGGQPQEALKDYQRALRLDPNNLEAQKNAADVQEQLGGEQQDENGAPAPAPITPNVADDE